MSEKVTPVFLPPINEQGVQQLTVRDATIFIGREKSHRSKSLCTQCLMVLGMLFVFSIGAVMLGPKLGRLNTVIVVGQPAGPCNNPSVIDTTTGTSTTSATASSTNGIPNGTVIYSLLNPAVALSSYMKIATLYTAQGYRTTLSFVLRNQQGNTNLDDVSVISYGKELLTNGNFESSTNGWKGADTHSNYIYPHNGSTCHQTHSRSEDIVSQTFWTTPGAVLNISFQLQWDKSGTGIAHRVIVSP